MTIQYHSLASYSLLVLSDVVTSVVIVDQILYYPIIYYPLSEDASTRKSKRAFIVLPTVCFGAPAVSVDCTRGHYDQASIMPKVCVL